jgi:hypothetical protein
LRRYSRTWLGLTATLLLFACSSTAKKVPETSTSADAGSTDTSRDVGSDMTPSPDRPADTLDGGKDATPSPDRPADTLDCGRSPDGLTDAMNVADAGCTVETGDPCSILDETCARAAGCCACLSDNADPPTLRWLCLERHTSGVCSSYSRAPSSGGNCSPATMYCPFCEAGVPKCYYCFSMTSNSTWMSVSLASCK